MQNKVSYNKGGYTMNRLMSVLIMAMLVLNVVSVSAAEGEYTFNIRIQGHRETVFFDI